MNKDNEIIIEFGLNRIEELKEKEKKFEEIIKNEKRDLKDDIMLNNFDEYLKKLSYESAKEVIEQVRYILDYKEYKQLKDGILQEIKLRDYPVLDVHIIFQF